jgi:electron transfer flavoprotein beta subunit
MKIVVPVKQILDPSGITFRRDKERMFVNREDYILDPGSKAALEAALQLKEQAVQDSPGSSWTVIALSVGEPQAGDALREALAMGCDAAYLVTDPAFKDADISVTVRLLAAAIERLGKPDLIVAGRESGDTGAGQIGARLAGAIDFAQITDVYALNIDNGWLQATRRWAASYATVQTPLPAVVTVAPKAFPPRLPHGARIMNAYREWEVTVWGLEDLDLSDSDLEPRLALRRAGFPPPLETGEILRGDPDTVAQDAVITLRLQKLIG